MKKISTDKIEEIQNISNKKVAVKIIKETNFYEAEEHHQNYGLKNPLKIEKEFIESGRKK
jgi:peptide methionine sulfoxide reductase MsrA